MKTLIILMTLIVAAPLFAASLTITTTPAQDAAVLWKCGENCTAQQAKDYVESEFTSKLNDWVREKQEADYTKQDVQQLWKDADATARCNAITALGGSC